VLDALIAFLEEARRSLDALPASHDGRPVTTGVSLLETLLENARSRPARPPAPSVAGRKRQAAAPGEPSGEAELAARELCDRFNSWI